MITIKTVLYDHLDYYQKPYPVIIFSGNIEPTSDLMLPHCTDSMVNFQFQYSPVYSKVSNGKVNTRFTYPYGSHYKRENHEGYIYAFGKFNWLQRRKLHLINKTSIWHKHPKTIIGFAINILGFIPLWYVLLYAPAENNNLSKEQTTSKQIKEQQVGGSGYLLLEYTPDSSKSADTTKKIKSY